MAHCSEQWVGGAAGCSQLQSRFVFPREFYQAAGDASVQDRTGQDCCGECCTVVSCQPVTAEAASGQACSGQVVSLLSSMVEV